MSEENVQVILEALAAWNAGDMDRLSALCDPDAIVRAPPDWPEPGPFVGREAIMRQFSQMREAFDSDTLEQLSDVLTSGDRVLVRFTWKVAGQGPAVEVAWTFVYTVRRGLIYGLEYVPSHEEALETAGLSE